MATAQQPADSKLSDYSVAKLILGYLEEENLNAVKSAFIQSSPHVKENDLDDVFFKSLKRILMEYKNAKVKAKNYIANSEFKEKLIELKLPELIAFLFQNMDSERVRLQSEVVTEECSICIEDMLDASEIGIKTLPCSHRFHVWCIETWLERSATCPYCRQDVD